MRKYTSKSDKIKLYSMKYKMSEEEIYRILTDHESLLTFDDLKIRYDCPTLGKLPDWLTEEELDLMIWKCVHTVYDERYMWTTREDLHGDLQVIMRYKMHLFTSHAHLKTAIYNRLKQVLEEHIWRSAHFSKSLDQELRSELDKEEKVAFEYYVQSKHEEEDASDLIRTLNSIKNISIRNLLIVTGYLVANIGFLQEAYLDILNNSSDDVRDNLLLLEQYIYDNDDIERMRIDNKPCDKKRSPKLKIQDVIKAMNFNVGIPSATSTDILKELRFYLTSTGLASNLVN